MDLDPACQWRPREGLRQSLQAGKCPSLRRSFRLRREVPLTCPEADPPTVTLGTAPQVGPSALSRASPVMLLAVSRTGRKRQLDDIFFPSL